MIMSQCACGAVGMFTFTHIMAYGKEGALAFAPSTLRRVLFVSLTFAQPHSRNIPILNLDRLQ